MTDQNANTPLVEPQKSVLAQLRFLLTARQSFQMIILIIGMFVAAILETIGIGSIPVFVSFLIDPDQTQNLVPFLPIGDLVAGIPPETLIPMGAAMLVAFFTVKNLYLAGLVYVEGRFLRDICAGIAGRIFRAYLQSPYLLHLQRNPALSLRNVTTEVDQTRLLLRMSVISIREMLVMTLILALLVYADPVTSVATFAILGTAGVIFIATVRKKIFASGVKLQDSRSGQLQRINQGLGSLKVAKILGREEHLIAGFEAETSIKESEMFFQRFLSAMPRLFLETTAIGAVLIVILAYAFLGRDTATLLPILALLAISVVRLVPALTTITTGLTQIQAGRAALNAIVSDLVLFGEGHHDQLSAKDHNDASSLEDRGTVKASDISFSFPGMETAALENISLSIKSGEAVGIIGPSGSGKSTLVDIILGLLEPEKGQVRVNNIDIHNGPKRRSVRFGYIPQEIYLLDDTVQSNIAFGLPTDEIDRDTLIKAAKDAQLHEFIENLPEGYNTVVGDRGARLSGGQRQRIGIARALYHDPSVLVMDEATSALDGETENEVISAIRNIRGTRTLIIIAHRLNTIRDCDRIFKLENGRLVDEGSFDKVVGDSV